MKIVVNNKEMEIQTGSSIKKLSLELQLAEKGVAVAVNNKMIPRAEWERFVLKEADSVIVIKAACGG